MKNRTDKKKKKKSNNMAAAASSSSSPTSSNNGGSTEATTSSSVLLLPTNLATFIQHDIDPQQGHHLLLPFFTTTDLLHLSQCAKALLHYRHHHLSHLTIIPSKKRKALMNLLRSQQQGITHLSIAYRKAIPILEEMEWYGLDRLECFEVSSINIKDKEMDCFVRGLRQGAFPQLHTLIMVCIIVNSLYYYVRRTWSFVLFSL